MLKFINLKTKFSSTPVCKELQIFFISSGYMHTAGSIVETFGNPDFKNTTEHRIWISMGNYLKL